MLPSIKIKVNTSIFLKDPESSELGRRIVSKSVDLMDELGFEHFTFKKLSVAIGSTEASVYRYFENKHKLLLYLSCWYWRFLEYRLRFALANIDSPQTRLIKALEVITKPETVDNTNDFIDINQLNRVVVSESSKAYLTKEVDEENKEGAFLAYKQLVAQIANIIHELNPKYAYPHMLVSTVFEGSHLQRFFAQHLPKLTNVVKGEDTITDFYTELVLKSIDSNR